MQFQRGDLVRLKTGIAHIVVTHANTWGIRGVYVNGNHKPFDWRNEFDFVMIKPCVKVVETVKASCENCHFAVSNGTGWKAFDCHRYPPTNSESVVGPTSVLKDWWCGEFKPKGE